ncbi:fructosamine kinase family protein [Vitiosangium sp. GDMCC 1.1324]|uniref:fructosamine kinase family protein n=1 Tax=Vitiosangium sp. (strain GDMCC 1.1324) TaxID=2138576 RepID=UPI00130EDC5A|nr:fructosamine kinase family protein [Vitiosangium sp. GDMCC 1.1324]
MSAFLGRAWRVLGVQDRSDAASHPAAILSDDTFSIFVKLGVGELAREQFNRELSGLRTLTERAGVLTPTGLGIVQVGDEALLVLEAVDVVERTPEHWRQMGRALARLHGVKGERFGFETHAYWGSLFQDNTPLEGWVDFFRERRLVPRLRAAIASGHLPPDVAARVERLGDRLPELCGPPVVPALLHGDAHQNNFLSTPAGPVLLDPAVYYGHPELELAYIDFFAPVPEEFFHGYRELAPVDPGFAERRELWRIPAWLAMVEVDGAQHVDALTNALRAYE